MRWILALTAGSLLALSAGAGVASASVSAAELQQMITSELAGQVGAVPVAADCPGDLATDVGSSITCAVTIGDETRGVTITVASAENGQLGLSMQPAKQ